MLGFLTINILASSPPIHCNDHTLDQKTTESLKKDSCQK